MAAWRRQSEVMVRERSGGETGAASAVDDRELLRRIAAADLVAFETFYRRHYVRLLRFVTRTAQRTDMAEEVINDTMMVVWDKAHGFRGDARPTTWLMGIAWRKTMQQVRGAASAPATVDVDEIELEDPMRVEQWAEDQQFGRVLRECLDGLSAAHRAVVELTYFDGYTSREIAVILDCPEGTVRTRMLHARRRLRGLLAERGLMEGDER